MIRSLAKGSMLFAFGWLPGGPHLYRFLTRNLMGTQASHVDKLARVYPIYVDVWENRLGLDLEGAKIWIHEGGWTLFPFLFCYALTGKGPTVTNCEGQLQDKYTQHAIDALSGLPCLAIGARAERVAWIKAQEPADVQTWIQRLDATYLGECEPGKIPIDDGSIAVCHSGGTLEHLTRDELQAFAKEVGRILQSGGVSSHVVDHRDHLYHADKGIPFLNHLRYSPAAYRVLWGHKLLFHNRLSTGQYREVFSNAGLKEALVRRLLLPNQNFAETDEEAITGLLGLERSRLHASYTMSDADLHTAACHYLFRKQ